MMPDADAYQPSTPRAGLKTLQVHWPIFSSSHPCSFFFQVQDRTSRELIATNGNHKTHLLLFCYYILSVKGCGETVGVRGFVKVSISDFNVNKLWKPPPLK